MRAQALESLTLLALFAAMGSIAAESQAAQTEDDRVIRATDGFVKERAPDELRNTLELERLRTSPDRLIVKQSDRGPTIQSHTFGDSYIFEARTELFYDYDGDGYYHYLRVQFDADTVYETTLVYAMIFLSADGEAWEHLYTTDDFRIWGEDPEDDYEVESELVSGYSTGHYDVLIELYDAVHGDLMDEFGPLESSALSLLPLEDSVRDGVDPGPGPIHDDDGGGGAMDWWTVPALLLAVAIARRRRRPIERPFEVWLLGHPEVLAQRTLRAEFTKANRTRMSR